MDVSSPLPLSSYRLRVGKIHISAYPADTLMVAKVLIRYLICNKVNFKFFHNLADFYRICAGIGEQYTQAGKFFTIYLL